MKRLASVLLAVTAVVSIGACSSNTPAPTATKTVTSTVTKTVAPKPVPSTQEFTSAEQRYIAIVRDNAPAAANITDKSLVRLGHVICTDLNNGSSVRDVVMSLAEAADTKAQVRLFGAELGAGIAVFCPRYLPELKRLGTSSA